MDKAEEEKPQISTEDDVKNQSQKITPSSEKKAAEDPS